MDTTSLTCSFPTLLKTPLVSLPQKYPFTLLFSSLLQQYTKPSPLYKSTFLQQHFGLPLGVWRELFKLIPPKHKFRKQVTYMDTSSFQLLDKGLWLLMESKPENFNSTMDAKNFSNFQYKLKTVKEKSDSLCAVLEERESEILKIVSTALEKELSSVQQLKEEMDIINTFTMERYFFVEEKEYELYVDVVRLSYKYFYTVGTLRLKSQTISDTEHFNQLMSQLAQLEVMVPVQSKIVRILQRNYPAAYKAKTPVLHAFDPTTDQHPFEGEVYAAWLNKELEEAREYYKSWPTQDPLKPQFVDEEEMLTVYLLRNTLEQGVENPEMICATGTMKAAKAFDPKLWGEEDEYDEEEVDQSVWRKG